MQGFFEDSQSLEYSLSHKHLFYCFINSTMNNDLPILPHWHYYMELIYVTKGQGRIILGGKTILLSKGDVVFIFPQDVHAIEAYNDNDFEYAVIKFDPIILFDSPHDAFMQKNILPVIQTINPLLKVIKLDHVPISLKNNIIDAIDLFEAKCYGYEFLVKSKIMLIYHSISLRFKSYGYDLISDPSPEYDLTPIIPAFKYIYEHFSEPLTAKSVAEYCHLSYSYFSRQFKNISGITFTQYLNFTRITEAERLLIKEYSSITEIAYKVGYNDTSYFIRQFKSFKKVTPKQYIKLVRIDR